MLATKYSIAEHTQKHNQTNHAAPGINGIDYAIATHFKNKQCFGNRATFTATQGNIKRLAASVKRGYSFTAATFTGNHRNEDNFIAAQMTVLDLDDLTAADYARLHALDDLQHAALIYETPSHTDAAPRCRVVFVLLETIPNLDEYRTILAAIVYRFESLGFIVDPASKTPTQPYYGSTEGRQWVKPAAILPAGLLAIWVAEHEAHTAAELEASRHDAPAAYTPGDSGDLPADLITAVVQALGVDTSRVESEGWTRKAVKCPIKNHEHDKERPAFYWNVNKNSGKCHKCKTSINTVDTARLLGIDPTDYYPKAPRPSYYISSTNQKDEQTSAQNAPVHRVNVPYMTAPDVTNLIGDSGVYVLQSPQGTGKTEYIARRAKTDWLDNSVLYVNHRQALTGDVSRRLQFESQLSIAPDYQRSAKHLSCTLPSIVNQFDPFTNQLTRRDVLIIDEIEQVLIAISASTVSKSDRAQLFNTLAALIRDTPLVICMDADAGKVAINFVRSIRDDVTVIINEHPGKMRKMRMFDRDLTLIKDLDTIAKETKPDSRPVMVACSSKTFAEKLGKRYAEKISKRGGKMLVITRSTKNAPDVREFLSNPDTHISKYRLVIYSPTMGSGVDISTPIEAAYGFFNRQPITAWDSMQMLLRARHADIYKVWASPVDQKMVANPDTLYSQYLNREQFTKDVVIFDDAGRDIVTIQRLKMLRLRCATEARANQSKRNIRDHFTELAKGRFEIVGNAGSIGQNDAQAIRKELKHAGDEIKQERKAALKSATPVSEREYRQKAVTGQMTPTIEAGHERQQIEDTYAQEIDDNAIDDWQEGKGKSKLRLFESLFKSRDQAQLYDYKQLDAGVPIGDLTHATGKRDLLLQALKIFTDDNRVLSSEPVDLAEIIAHGETFKTEHEPTARRLFKWRSDYSEKPLNMLRFLAGQIGLKIERVNRSNDKSVMKQYRLCPETLERMTRYTRQRAKIRIETYTPFALDTRQEVSA